MKKLVAFQDLSKADRDKIRELIPTGRVEVSCPWWPAGHWEVKDKGEP